MKPPIFVIDGIAQKGLTVTCTDLVQTLSDAQLLYNNKLPIAALITAEAQSIRFFEDGTVPTQGIDGSGAVGHVLYASQSFLISNSANIRNFNFINAVNSLQAIIQITLFYEIGV